MAAVTCRFKSVFFMQRSVVSRWSSVAGPLGQSPYCKRQPVATFLTVGEYGMRWKFWRTTDDRRLTAFVEPHFLNVVRHGRLHESAERLARSSGLANRSGRNRLVNLVQQMNGYTLQHKISRGCLLMKRTRHFHARTQARWQRVSNISE